MDLGDNEIRELIEARTTRVMHLLYEYLQAQAVHPGNKGYVYEAAYSILAADALRLYLALYALDEGAG